jgi:PKD domain
VLSIGYGETPVTLASQAYPAGWTTAGINWRLEFEALGAAPTKLRARLYKVAAIPPGNYGWLTVGDEAGPQVAGLYNVHLNRGVPTAALTQAWDIADVYATDPPVPTFTYTATGLTATFATTGTTGDFTSYSWDWGDGTANGTGTTPSHTYAAPGTWIVRLTGTTRWGATFSAQGGVTVAAPLPAPPDLLPMIRINGEDVCADVYSVTWTLGRTSWWAGFGGETCSIRLRGIYPASQGMSVTIAVPNAAGGTPLWVGVVDQVTEVTEPVDARDETMVVAMDMASQLGRQHLDYGMILGQTDLPGRLADLRAFSSVHFRYRYGSPVAGGRWLQLKKKTQAADKLRDRTWLDMVNDALLASLAFGYNARDGAIAYAPVEAPPGLPSTPAINLNAGLDCASRVTLDRNALDGMIDRWTVGSGEDFDVINRPAVEHFGERAYSVPADTLQADDLFQGATGKFDGIFTALANPARAATVEVLVTDWEQKCVSVSPLDFATWNGKLYSVVGVSHDIALGQPWRVTLNLDRNPWEIYGGTPP